MQVLLVLMPRHAIDARRRPLLEAVERQHQPEHRDVVQQRGEPRLLIPSCHFPHAVQPTWHALPGTASGTCFAVRVPHGSPPFLPRLRGRSLVRRDRRYYGAIRLPVTVHPGITASAFPRRPARRPRGRAATGSPGSRPRWFRTCPGSQTARGPLTARDSAASDVAFRFMDSVGTPDSHFAAQ